MPTPSNYRIGAGDKVFVDVWGASQKTFEGTVSPDGTITIENVGPVKLAGLTVRAGWTTRPGWPDWHFDGLTD